MGVGFVPKAEGAGGGWSPLCLLVAPVPSFTWPLGERGLACSRWAVAVGAPGSRRPRAEREACLPQVGEQRDCGGVTPQSCPVSRLALRDLLSNGNHFPIFFKALGGNRTRPGSAALAFEQ